MPVTYWIRDIDTNPKLYRVMQDTFEEQHWSNGEWVPHYELTPPNANKHFTAVTAQEAKALFPKAFH